MASGTIYDDVHHTLVNDQPKLLLAVINEAHGENYTGEEKIVQRHNEHYFKRQGGETDKKITDNYLEVYSNEKVEGHHIESQSTPDSSITKRVFEYDVQIALEEASVSEIGLTVKFPKSAVIYLRSNRNTPDVLETTIQTPGGIVTYNVPILKIQNYSIEEIFEKKLFFFIPFHIFVYENKIEEYNGTMERVKELQERYTYICRHLQELVSLGEIDEYTRCSLMEMTMKVVNALAAKFDNIKKGIGEVMGGKVLDYEAKDIWNAGRSEGIQLGRSEGWNAGHNEGIQLGRSEGKLETYIALIKDSILSLGEAAKRLGMSEEELRERM